MKLIQTNNIKKIVVIQTAFIGDTALALFFCDNVKKIFSDAEILFVCTPISHQLISNSTNIDHCLAFDKRNKGNQKEIFQRLVFDINSFNPDIVFSLHRSIRTSKLVSKINAQLKVGFKNSALNWVYDEKCNYDFCMHEIERNNELLKPFGYISNHDYQPIEIRSNADISGLFSSKKNIYISPGSVWFTKQWLPKYFNETIIELEKFGYNAIIGGSKSERNLCKEIAKNTNATVVAGDYELNDIVNIIKKCDLVICNDSASTHLAGLAGCKCLTIYGATDEIFGFAPVSKGSKNIRNNELQCSPCAIHGGKKCPLKHFKCMRELLPYQVIEKAKSILN